jgi:hypothetical protein
MPFGQKPDPGGRSDIDFDKIYNNAIKKGISDSGMEPVRADEERTGGIIHKPMFERLLLCDYVLADLTAANPNVFYELGVRHTARPATTLTIFAKNHPIPFDVNFLRSMPYDLGEDNAFGDEEARVLHDAIVERLTSLRERAKKGAEIDSPLFQLVSDWNPGDIAHIKTDVFRDQVKLNEELKQRLAEIRTKARIKGKRQEALQELREMKDNLDELDTVDVGTHIDLFLSFRACEDWDGMLSFFDKMPDVLKRQILVREQLGFAYNRRAGQTENPADRAKALKILEEVEEQQGPSSETCGLIGRIYKDTYTEALAREDNEFTVRGYLKKSIEAYLRGFNADFRDAYPGINAVTLLDVRGDEKSLKEKEKLLPIVRFAVERRLKDKPDYWDHATMLELSVLENDFDAAEDHLENALSTVREPWEPKTTAYNLRMIEKARKDREIDTSWLLNAIDALDEKTASDGLP